MSTKDESNKKKSNQKVYPSQLNSKSIACRIPIADYVKFQQEAISQQINLNDWLLAKIYTERHQPELVAADHGNVRGVSHGLNEAINANLLTRQVEETLTFIIDLILKHDTLLIFPGEDFEQGFILRTAKETGTAHIDKTIWKSNFYRKLLEFAEKNKKK